jgi:hypothetical protein
MKEAENKLNDVSIALHDAPLESQELLFLRECISLMEPLFSSYRCFAR